MNINYYYKYITIRYHRALKTNYNFSMFSIIFRFRMPFCFAGFRFYIHISELVSKDAFILQRFEFITVLIIIIIIIHF